MDTLILTKRKKSVVSDVMIMKRHHDHDAHARWYFHQ